MHPEKLAEQLRRWKERQQRLLDGMQKFERLVTDYPDVFKEFLRLYSDGNMETPHRENPLAEPGADFVAGDVVIQTKAADGDNLFQQVAAYFVKTGNEWATTKEIRQGASVSRSGVTFVLYRSANRQDFEKQRHATDDRMMMWRLKDSVYQQEKNRMAQDASDMNETEEMVAAR